MINKNGLSNVVATVLLISLTIAAIVLLAGFLFPFIKNIWKSGTECYEYLDYYNFDEESGFNCYEIVNGGYKYAISISADSSDEELGKEIKGLDLVFSKEGVSLPKRINENSPIESDFRMIDPIEMIFKIPKNGESFTYVYNSSINFENVNIYPVLESGRRCDKTDTISIRNVVCENVIS